MVWGEIGRINPVVVFSLCDPAIRLYEKHGLSLISDAYRDRLRKRSWNLSAG